MREFSTCERRTKLKSISSQSPLYHIDEARETARDAVYVAGRVRDLCSLGIDTGRRVMSHFLLETTLTIRKHGDNLT